MDDADWRADLKSGQEIALYLGDETPIGMTYEEHTLHLLRLSETAQWAWDALVRRAEACNKAGKTPDKYLASWSIGVVVGARKPPHSKPNEKRDLGIYLALRRLKNRGHSEAEAVRMIAEEQNKSVEAIYSVNRKFL